MVKPKVTLSFVSLNIWEYLHVQVKILIKSIKSPDVRDDMLVCNNIVSFEDFSVLANGTNGFKAKLLESILMLCDGSQLKATSETVLWCFSLKAYQMFGFMSFYRSSESLDK